MITGYVPGAWDMFHIGHLNILMRARDLCDSLIVGVVTDAALFEAKAKHPVVPLEERMECVAALDLVDRVVVDFSIDKVDVWQRVGFDVLFKGDDWRGTAKGDRLETAMRSVGVQVRYFPYTAFTSSTRPAVDPRHSLTAEEAQPERDVVTLITASRRPVSARGAPSSWCQVDSTSRATLCRQGIVKMVLNVQSAPCLDLRSTASDHAEGRWK